MEQITIFDIADQAQPSSANEAFNLSKANVLEKKFMGNDVEKYCIVSAIIPEDVRSPIELGVLGERLKHGSPEYESRKERWSNYVYAIWRYERWENGKSIQECSWNKATQMLKEARESKKPITMRVSLNSGYPFYPDQVVQYL